MGYRLVAPVTKEDCEENLANRQVITSPTQIPFQQESSKLRLWLILSLLLFVILMAGVLWYGQDIDKQQTSTQVTGIASGTTDHAITVVSQGNKSTISDDETGQSPTILVLPFRNLGSNNEEEYFIDGITEDIITDLSRLSGLLVLASNTSFRYKGQTIVPQELGKELNASHILEGGVRKAGDKLRITAQLTDTQKGHHIWANRYDRKLTDIFAVQDDVTQSIVNALALHLSDQDKAALAHKAAYNIQAYELFLRGQSLHRQRTKETNKQAEEILKEAINLDPSYARSYGTLALTMTMRSISGWAENAQESLDRALELAHTAVSLDVQSPHAYWSLSFVHLFRGEHHESVDAVQRSIALSPSYADAYGMLAFVKNYMGEAEESIKLIHKAMGLNPNYSWDYLLNLGFAYYTLGEFEKANDYLEKAQNRNPNIRNLFLFRAATFVELGMQDEAEWEIEQLLQLYPDLTVTFLSSRTPLADKNARERYLNNLREAGLPE
jgi:adenylate cyclase